VNVFEAAYGAKFPKAAAKITDGMEELLAFYDYTCEHWVHRRATNLIESHRCRCPASAQALPVCHRGHGGEWGWQRGADRSCQQASLASDGGLPLRGECGFELIEHPVKAPDHLGRVGAVTDDLGQ
jgi:hypothetical protein